MNTQINNTLTANAEIKSAAQATNNTMFERAIETGDVLVSSWGYEQTNVDFYQVVGATAKSLKLRRIKQENSWNTDRTSGGKTIPKVNDFSGEVFTRRYSPDRDYVKIADRMYASKWNGKPQSFTSYA